MDLRPFELNWQNMNDIDLRKHYKVRDSVDVYLIGDDLLCVYFISSRQRISFKVSKPIVDLFEKLDGKKCVADILAELSSKYGVKVEDILPILEKMHKTKILSECDLCDDSTVDKERYDRQINYFSDFFADICDAVRVQAKLQNSRIAIFGCGAVGGDIAMLLSMSGVGNFYLVDDDVVTPADAARHMYYNPSCVGQLKISVLAETLLKINKNAKVNQISLRLNPDTKLDDILGNVDFVVNTMDEPYIGYTAAKLSRDCFRFDLPHYIAGGFDAHLASTGELVVPYITPCVECYATHFKRSLAGWKPRKHPVVKRYREIGGLSSMSLFSASYAAIDIIKYLAGLQNVLEIAKSRGEFLITDMSLQYLDIVRDPQCHVCGGR